MPDFPISEWDVEAALHREIFNDCTTEELMEAVTMDAIAHAYHEEKLTAPQAYWGRMIAAVRKARNPTLAAPPDSPPPLTE